MSQHHTQYGDLPLYIGGEAYPSASEAWIEVTNPADQSLLARVPRATPAPTRLLSTCALLASGMITMWFLAPTKHWARLRWSVAVR